MLHQYDLAEPNQANSLIQWLGRCDVCFAYISASVFFFLPYQTFFRCSVGKLTRQLAGRAFSCG